MANQAQMVYRAHQAQIRPFRVRQASRDQKAILGHVASGQESYSALSNQFEMPNVGAGYVAFIQEPTPIANDSIVTIGDLGFLRFTRAGAGGLQMIVWNDLDYPGNKPPGSIAPAGSLVVAVGPRGLQGIQCEQGLTGSSAFSYTEEEMVMPPVGVGFYAVVQLADVTPFYSHMLVHVDALGWLLIVSVNPAT